MNLADGIYACYGAGYDVWVMETEISQWGELWWSGERKRGGRGSVRDPDYTRLMRQCSTTNPLSWQGNVDYRKSAFDYATLGRAFRNCFSFQNVFQCIHKYDDCGNHQFVKNIKL